jgi:hypothetical protein
MLPDRPVATAGGVSGRIIAVTTAFPDEPRDLREEDAFDGLFVSYLDERCRRIAGLT